MGANLDMERIAKELGAERRGKVSARGGYFGALQLAAEVSSRFRVPDGGGRPADLRRFRGNRGASDPHRRGIDDRTVLCALSAVGVTRSKPARLDRPIAVLSGDD